MTTHGIDATFRLRREAAAARRRRARWRKAGAGLLATALAAAAVAFYLTRDEWSFGDTDEELHAVDEAAEMPDDAPVYVPAIVDLAGDPMWITMSREAASKGRSVVRPVALASENGISPRIQVLADAMLSTSERFMTTIPSSQEDFAFFQAQRAAAVAPAAPLAEDEDVDLQPAPVAADPAPDAGGEAAGWGEAISDEEGAPPEVAKTTVENNTTVAVVRPEFERFASTEDQFLKILTERSLESVLLEQHFGADDAKLADAAMKATFGREVLEPGYVVAMRGFRARREALVPRLMQVSVYARNTFVGTLARNPAGGFVSAADPWVREDLFNYSGTTGRQAPQAAIPAARRDLFDRRAQQRADRRHRRGHHVAVARPGPERLRHGERPPGADLFGHAARQGRRFRSRPLCRRQGRRKDPGMLRLPAGRRRVRLRQPRRPGPFADRRQWHGNAGERRHDLHLRAAHASGPEGRPQPRGRRLGRPRGNADLRRLRWQDRLPGRGRNLRQSGAHRPSGRSRDALRAHAALRPGVGRRHGGAGGRRDRLRRHHRPLDRAASAFRAPHGRPADRPARHRHRRRLGRLGGREADRADHPCRERRACHGEKPALLRQRPRPVHRIPPGSA